MKSTTSPHFQVKHNQKKRQGNWDWTKSIERCKRKEKSASKLRSKETSFGQVERGFDKKIGFDSCNEQSYPTLAQIPSKVCPQWVYSVPPCTHCGNPRRALPEIGVAVFYREQASYFPNHFEIVLLVGRLTNQPPYRAPQPSHSLDEYSIPSHLPFWT